MNCSILGLESIAMNLPSPEMTVKVAGGFVTEHAASLSGLPFRSCKWLPFPIKNHVTVNSPSTAFSPFGSMRNNLLAWIDLVSKTASKTMEKNSVRDTRL